MGSYFLYLYKSSANKLKYKIFGTEEAVNNLQPRCMIGNR